MLENTADCDDVIGACTCSSGWEGDTCETNIDECVTSPDVCGDDRKLCIDTDGSYECDCDSGFTINAASECLGNYIRNPVHILFGYDLKT